MEDEKHKKRLADAVAALNMAIDDANADGLVVEIGTLPIARISGTPGTVVVLASLSRAI
ncbi:hypothetical protein BBAL3_835 [Brevundimonas sp. BAL3]|uniref:hypothetical protein n=1 Tax=Brevundimonas sp. BAL3 TaxID=391600 RepID=UPI00017EBEB2|nr:hypothetical protein [Brevundimonas sp. BAL3]EDX79678.1 hypothetical protein BBAL3_835 [Brevundimonas sp. BAL3]